MAVQQEDDGTRPETLQPQVSEQTGLGLDFETSEATPLLSKDHHFVSPQPESLADDEDIEGQSKSWQHPPGVLSRTKARGVALARLACTPKQWNRQAVWNTVVVQPVKYLPATVLGLLLNILDALSYGKSLLCYQKPKFFRVDSDRLRLVVGQPDVLFFPGKVLASQCSSSVKCEPKILPRGAFKVRLRV